MNLKKYFLIFLLSFSFLLRIWGGASFFFWHVDEEITALTVKRILIEHTPQLIGFPIPGGIYLGPGIYYILSFFYLVGFMNPLNFPLLTAIVGTLTVFAVYKVGKIIFEDAAVGILAALLYGFSYLSNIYSRLLTGLTFPPIFALLTYYLLYRLIKSGRQRHLFALGLVLLVATQDEATSLSLLVLSAMCWLLFRFRVRAKSIAIIAAAFLVFHLPLLIFDLRHNHFLIQSFLSFFSSKNDSPPLGLETIYNGLLVFPLVVTRFLAVNGPKNISDQILPCADLLTEKANTIFYPVLVIATFALFYFVFSTLKKRVPTGNKIVLSHLLIISVGIILFNLFFHGYFFEWMFVIFFPGVSFILALFLKKIFASGLWGKIIFAVLLTIFIVFNVQSLFKTNGDFSLKNKVDAVSFALTKVKGKPFQLESLGSCYAQGYIYLFWQRGQLPVKSYADEMFSSTLNLNPTGIKPQVSVVIVNPSKVESREFYDKYLNYLAKSKDRAKFGKIEVLIGD